MAVKFVWQRMLAGIKIDALLPLNDEDYGDILTWIVSVLAVAGDGIKLGRVS